MDTPRYAEQLIPDEIEGVVGYFSMEIALNPAMPTYSGGLGVLAGDTLRSAADLGLPLAAISLAHRNGYFRQHLSATGVQSEEPQPWNLSDFCKPEDPRVFVQISGRSVSVCAWRYDIQGVTGHTIPVYLLDTDLEENTPEDRLLTSRLYGGDSNYRLEQEAVLGIGGARMLEALGLDISVYHMNEGHAALLTVALLERELDGRPFESVTDSEVEGVRARSVFTTHTPVPAGHDRFGASQANSILGEPIVTVLDRLGCFEHSTEHEPLLNMTMVALRFSRFVNAVALQHALVSRKMFPGYKIDSITNGVHAGTWLSPAMQTLLDQHLPLWRQDNVQFRNAIGLDPALIAEAHTVSKRRLIDEIATRTGEHLDAGTLTLGFARRAATYKRADLLFTDTERLIRIAQQAGGLQILYGGKAHPMDQPGKDLIHSVVEKANAIESGLLRILYLENYEWHLGQMLTSGVDVWVNTPRRPYEASGTSGMKAAMNGIPSLSILDGWWIEGCAENITGWAIEDGASDVEEAGNLYRKLEEHIVPMYKNDKPNWQKLMRSTIALNGSFFNTNRMLEQYIRNAYYPQPALGPSSADELETVAVAMAKHQA